MEPWMSTAKYLALTTFKRDGTPVATALWFIPGEDHVRLITEENSWKVKRIRNNPAVTVAACDVRGRTSSEPVAGTAHIMDDAALADLRRAIAKRYRLTAGPVVVWTWLSDKLARREPSPRVGIEIRFDDGAPARRLSDSDR